MAEETTISTPEETTVETDTATDEVTDTVTTSNDAPGTGNSAAETETEELVQTDLPPETKLYAGKYSSIEELEKGYGELNKAYTQANQIKAKYDEMLKEQQRQQALNLENAQKAGYNSPEEQDIANSVQLAEFNAFWNNIGAVNAESQPIIQQYLTEYYKTGNAEYLNAAKAFYPANFLEQVAVGKQQLQVQLQNELGQKQSEQKLLQEKELADVLKTDFAELLADVKENTGKAHALKAFCDADFIQSKEDMQVFADIYKQIADYERAAAIKEYEAQKVIANTKKAAQINSDNRIFQFEDKVPTYADIERMSQEDYNKAVDRWGLEKILKSCAAS